MKPAILKITICLLFFAGIKTHSVWALPNDSIQISQLKGEVKHLHNQLDSLAKKNKPDTIPCAKCGIFAGVRKGEQGLIGLLVLAPMVLVIITITWILLYLKRKKGVFASMLIEKKPEIMNAHANMMKATTEYLKQKNTNTDDCDPNDSTSASDVPPINPNPPNSSSRVIMFLSGIIALLLAGIVVSFYVYYYIRYNQEPQMGGLLYTLLSLGIGVVPYAVSKIKE